MAILDKQGLQHYANKMCNADNRKVGSKSLPTALNDIDTAIDGFKTLFESEYGTPVNMEIENNQNIFTIGTGININKKDDVENSFTDVELSGNSLVNLYPKPKRENYGNITGGVSFNGEKINIRANGTYQNIFLKKGMLNLKPSTTYTLIINISKNTLAGRGSGSLFVANTSSNEPSVFSNGSTLSLNALGIYKQILTTRSSFENVVYDTRCFLKMDCTDGEIEFTYILLEGDWTNKPIPQYFEGLKSIGEKADGNHKISISSVGKNLIDFKNPIKNVLTYAMGFPLETTQTLSSIGNRYVLLDNGFYFKSPNNSHNQGVGFYVKCKKNTNYILSCMVDFKNAPAIKCQGVYSNEIPINNYISRALLISKEKISTSDFSVTFNSQNYDYLLFYFGGSWLSQMPGSVDMKFTNIQLEEISKTPYQSYKEDKKEILLNEPLRGVGDTKDTIEKINGKWKIVRRCGEIVLNGSENWGTSGMTPQENTLIFQGDVVSQLVKPNSSAKSDKFATYNGATTDEEGLLPFSGTNGTRIYLRIKKSKLSSQDVVGFKKWLSQNPTKVVYQLATPIIEDISPITLQCWKNGTISINEVLPVETTHTVALNKSAQIQKNIEELTTLRNRVKALEEQYDKTALNQAYEVELLRLDMQLDNII